MRALQFAFLLVFLSLSPAHAGEISDAVRIPGLYGSEYFDIESEFVDETFRLFVASPSAVVEGQKYPVIYVLDGNAIFGMVTDTQRMMAFANEIPHAYIVAIGYAIENGFAEALNKRYRDYTPTKGGELEEQARAMFDPMNQIEAGGGPAFLKFLQEELKPAIESRYAVDPDDATFGGASLGGLFPSWVLLTAPETFQRYVIISPSIWWNGEEVWSWISAAGDRFDDIQARAFVTAGALETVELMRAEVLAQSSGDSPMAAYMRQFFDAYEKHGWARMAEITPTFSDKMNALGFSGLSIATHNMPHETHTSVPAGAWSRGLRYVFEHWEPTE